MNNTPMHALASVMTEKFIQAAPQAAAAALAGLATHEALLLISGLKAQTIVAVLNPMDPAKAAALLRRLALKQACYVLTHLEVPQAAKLWKEFAAPYQERLKQELAPAFVELLLAAREFGPQSVGALMQTDVVAVRTETKVNELVARLKNLPRPKIPAVCFVTNRAGELKGIIYTAELAFFNPQALCGSVMAKPAHVLHPQEALAAAQEAFTRAQTTVLGVVNEKNVLLGLVEQTILLQAATPTKKTLWEKIKG